MKNNNDFGFTTEYCRDHDLTEEEKGYFQHSYRGLVPTGEVLVKRLFSFTDFGGRYYISKVVFKGSYTPCGAIRDCGEYYIEAQYSRYVKIDKRTLKVIDNDCEDY